MTGLALYVHIPWCVRKCPYCDFNSHPIREPGLDENAYVDALLLDFDVQQREAPNRPIDSVFFGGGTPSLFSPDAFARILTHLQPLLAEDAEITMEANPGTTEHQDLATYRRAGINRLSLGVQSFNNDKLEALGRIHDVADVYRSFELARDGGFDNINLDLMFGLPNQTRQEALGDLSLAIELGPEHLSWYQLTLEPKTEFARRPPPLPGDIILEEMERDGDRLLAEAGYQRYEVSAYARAGRQCRHNLAYWTFGDYIGIGAGAHGKISYPAQDAMPVVRTRKPHQPRLYLQHPMSTTSNTIASEDLSGEFMLNALRLTEGVPLTRFEAATGLPLDTLEPLRSTQIERGLLREDRLAATERGYAVLDSLIQDYL
jgi:oxygen-independent coproporphyrinogen-3 oxidase